jgi:hypothetical protein
LDEEDPMRNGSVGRATRVVLAALAVGCASGTELGAGAGGETVVASSAGGQGPTSAEKAGPTGTGGASTSGTGAGGAGPAGVGGAAGGGGCAASETDCNGVCVDLMSNLSHCGGCNKPCVFGESCCTGECADLTTSEKHCGMCGKACGAQSQCLASQCKAACCGDNQNDKPPAGNCIQGAQWIAWDYTPSCSFNATRIELHADMGEVALLADANGKPGALLFQGALGAPDAMGWIGANIAPPVPLLGGQKYWIAEKVGLCSIASGGVAPMYYGSFTALGGPWEGPYQSYFWTAHIIGECGQGGMGGTPK